METLRRRPGRSVLLMLAAGLLTACAQTATGVVATVGPPCAQAPSTAPSTPTGTPIITVDDRVSFWLQNGHTAPLGTAVYADGTVIRAQDDGSAFEPLPQMTIGRVDGCTVSAALDRLIGLADADFGTPDVTDQGVTTVTVTPPGDDPVVLSAYALGIGDEYVDAGQAAARAELSAVIDGLAAAPTGLGQWTPDRLRITRFDGRSGPDEAGPARRWPLTVAIDEVLRPGTDRRLPCGALDGEQAAAVVDALAGGAALSTWDDGTDPALLAIAVLVPGQPTCESA